MFGSTIPKEIRDHLKAKEGEKVAFVLRGDDVILRMVRGNILDLKGGVKPPTRLRSTCSPILDRAANGKSRQRAEGKRCGIPTGESCFTVKVAK